MTVCGIVGTVGQGGNLQEMLQLVRHRGPDHRETFVDGPVAFGHARLSIIDLSAASDQPFHDPDTGAVMVYNGEIYNFKELREGLRRNGARFRTSGDTEVILQGYLAEGVRFFSRLNGIFAFAIWDPRARTVVLARDPVGVKPLYIHATPGSLAFASEAKALYTRLDDFRLDPVGLAGYLRFHYTPGPQTIVEGIHRFPPGESWTVSADGAVQDRQRMDLGPHRVGTGTLAAKDLWTLLDQAVHRQMVADVPVGSFLSGGIDSSIVTFLASRHTSGPINTYSVGFDEGGQDERPLAAELAHAIGSTHQELEVRGTNVARDFGTMSWHYDGPLGEGGCIPNWYVSELASRSVKVVLAGEGGDEVFGGYPWYALHHRLERWGRLLPKSDRLAQAFSRLPFPMGASANLLLRRGRWERYAALMEVTPKAQLARLGLPAPGLGEHPAAADPQAVDQQTLLRDCFLVKADTMTMAHGLEERVPFLDLQLVALQDRLPLAERLGPPEKKILREAAAGHLPGEVVARKKMGYGTPMGEWAATVLQDRIQRALREPMAVELGLAPQSLWDALAEHADWRAVSALRPSWLLFALDEWVRELHRRGYV